MAGRGAYVPYRIHTPELQGPDTMAGSTGAAGRHVQQRLLSRNMDYDSIGCWLLDRYAHTSDVATARLEHVVHRILPDMRGSSG